MENKERKYQQYGKFEDLLVKIEDEIQNGMRDLERDKQDLFYEMRMDTERTKNNVMTGENRSIFARKVRELIENSERSASNRDEEFSKEIMKKLVGVLKENVPDENYQDVDMKGFLPIAEQMVNKLQKELEEKEKANDGGFGGRVENGHFKKIKRDFDRHVEGVFTIKEMREVRLYVERMYDSILQLGKNERDVKEKTIASVRQQFDNFINQQRSMEQMADIQNPFSSYETQNNQISQETIDALNNAPNPFDSYEVQNNKMSPENEEALKNAPNPFSVGYEAPDNQIRQKYEEALKNAPVVNLDEGSMETIAPPPVQQPVIENPTKETMENIVPKAPEKEEKDDLLYEVLRQPQYDDTGKLIARGSAKTRNVGKLEDLGPGEHYVTIHYKDFDLTCTVKEAIKMLEHDRAIAQKQAKEEIEGRFK